MKKFQDKVTKVIYIANTEAIAEVFAKDSRYVEYKAKESKKPAKAKEDKKATKAKAQDELKTDSDASNSDEE